MLQYSDRHAGLGGRRNLPRSLNAKLCIISNDLNDGLPDNCLAHDGAHGELYLASLLAQ